MHFPCTKRAFFYNKVIIKQQNECNIYFTNSQQFTPIPSVLDPSMMGISHSFNMCTKHKENIYYSRWICAQFYLDFVRSRIFWTNMTYIQSLNISWNCANYFFFIRMVVFDFKTREIPSNFEIVKTCTECCYNTIDWFLDLCRITNISVVNQLKKNNIVGFTFGKLGCGLKILNHCKRTLLYPVDLYPPCYPPYPPPYPTYIRCPPSPWYPPYSLYPPSIPESSESTKCTSESSESTTVKIASVWVVIAASNPSEARWASRSASLRGVLLVPYSFCTYG